MVKVWTERYRPKKVSEMIGNEDARRTFYEWLKNWRRGIEPVFLVGPPGIGKTTMVHAAAKELGYFVMELNASDFRTKTTLERKLRGIGMVTITGEKTLLFLDEIDGLLSTEDRGGAEFLLDFLDRCEVPLVLAANREDLDFIKKIERKVKVLRLKRVPLREIELYLRYILEQERLYVSEEALRAAVVSSKGDVRAAINNLQSVITTGAPIVLYRDQDFTLLDVIKNSSMVRTKQELVRMLSNTLSDPENKILITYNSILASNLAPKDRVRALKAVADADLVLGRILRTQRWRMLRYLDRILADGLFNLALVPTDDATPWPIKRRIWNDAVHMRRLVSYISRRFRVSKGAALMFYFVPFLITAKLNNKLERIVHEAGLDERGFNAVLREVSEIFNSLR